MIFSGNEEMSSDQAKYLLFCFQGIFPNDIEWIIWKQIYLLERDSIPSSQQDACDIAGAFYQPGHKIWLDKDGFYHREHDFPAIIYYDRNNHVLTKHWWIHGHRYRSDDRANVVAYHSDGTIRIEYISK